MTTPNETEFVTREEFLTEVSDVKRQLSDVNRRVTGLFNLADRMGYSVTVPAADSVPESTPDTDTDAYDDSDRDVHGRPSGVDYVGAAYGLASIKRDADQSGASVPQDWFPRLVEWFVACFQGDESFDADTFRRNAGV